MSEHHLEHIRCPVCGRRLVLPGHPRSFYCACGRQLIPALPSGSEVAPTPERIVLVDHKAAHRIMVGAFLRRHGFEVVEFETGGHLLRYLAEGGAPGALVVDEDLPGVGGSLVLVEARRRGFAGPAFVLGGPHSTCDETLGRLTVERVSDNRAGLASLVAALRTCHNEGPTGARHGSHLA